MGRKPLIIFLKVSNQLSFVSRGYLDKSSNRVNFSFRVMREVGQTLGIPVHVFGNETHMTAIVSMALGRRPIPNEPTVQSHTANFLLPGGQNSAVSYHSFRSN